MYVHWHTSCVSNSPTPQNTTLLQASSSSERLPILCAVSVWAKLKDLLASCKSTTLVDRFWLPAIHLNILGWLVGCPRLSNSDQDLWQFQQRPGWRFPNLLRLHQSGKAEASCPTQETHLCLQTLPKRTSLGMFNVKDPANQVEFSLSSSPVPWVLPSRRSWHSLSV